jgi:regulator of replication initiation timing
MGQEPENTPQEGKAPEPATEPNKGQEPQGKEPATFDKEYVQSLRSESAQRRIEAQQLKEKLEEYEERDKSESEKLTGKVGKLSEENKGLASENAKLRVALQKNLPADLIDRLRGNTQEELQADADKLLSLVKTPDDTEKEPDFDGGAREPAPDPDSPDQAHSKLLLGLFGAPTNT